VKHSRPFSRVLSQSTGLVPQLMARTRELQRLEKTVLEHLPQALQGHCRLANLRDGTLVLQADSPVWGARLRYSVPNLLRELGRVRGMPRLKRIEILVRPARVTLVRHDNESRTLGSNSARLLREVAAATEDPDLRRAWTQLASRAGKRDD